MKDVARRPKILMKNDVVLAALNFNTILYPYMKKISQYVKFISTPYVIYCKCKYILNYLAGQVKTNLCKRELLSLIVGRMEERFEKSTMVREKGK
jgi:hypothetical protein